MLVVKIGVRYSISAVITRGRFNMKLTLFVAGIGMVICSGQDRRHPPRWEMATRLLFRMRTAPRSSRRVVTPLKAEVRIEKEPGRTRPFIAAAAGTRRLRRRAEMPQTFRRNFSTGSGNYRPPNVLPADQLTAAAVWSARVRVLVGALAQRKARQLGGQASHAGGSKLSQGYN